MRIDEQFNVSGRGTIIAGTIEDGEQPHLGDVAVRLGSGNVYERIRVVGIEAARFPTDPPVWSRHVGLIVAGDWTPRHFIGATVGFDKVVK